MKGVTTTSCLFAAVVLTGAMTVPAAGAGLAGSGDGASAEVFTVDDTEMIRRFEQGMAKIIDAGRARKFEELRGELKRKSCELDLPAAGSGVLSPSELYKRCRPAVVMVSTFFHCPDPECKHWHSNIATGYLIHPDGIVVTNHHVVGSAQPGSMAMGVRTADGGVYAVGEVLAANRKDDVAILRLATDRGDFPHVMLGRDLPAGSEVTVISHPDKELYSLAHGCVSRHFIDPYTRARTMSITADFGKGSSGGPVFGEDGNVAGMVVSTKSLAYTSLRVVLDADNSCLRKATEEEIRNQRRAAPDKRPEQIGFGHQMTFKHCVPVSSIRKLIK